MFLHVGGVTNIAWDKIISIHDWKNFKHVQNEQLLQRLASEKRVIALIADSEVKSVVITDEHIYLSGISSNTLRKRAGYCLGMCEERGMV